MIDNRKIGRKADEYNNRQTYRRSKEGQNAIRLIGSETDRLTKI